MMFDIICRPHYSATVRAKSNADLIYKSENVLEEADESHYWLEVGKEAGLMQGKEGTATNHKSEIKKSEIIKL